MKRVKQTIFCILVLSLVQCTAQREEKKPRTWSLPKYESCNLNLSGNWSQLPADIGLDVINTNLPTSRYDCFNSSRPFIINGASHNSLEMGTNLDRIPGQTRISFDFWSSDGSTAYLFYQWESPENAMMEEFTGEAIVNPSTYLADLIAYDAGKNSYLNLTEIGRVSFYNMVAFAWPLAQNKIGFHAIYNGLMQPFVMNTDGSEKKALTNSSGVAYTTMASPDGSKIAFHSNYKLFIRDLSTGVEQGVATPCKFNFFPVWSPDSQKIAFFCGSSNVTADVYLVNRDGQGLKKLASRNGYSGIVPFLDVFDYHGGGSDYVTWSKDSNTVYYAAYVQATESNELFSVDVNTNAVTQLTSSNTPGVINYFPDLSPDGATLLYGSTKSGSRELYAMNLANKTSTQVTALGSGCGFLSAKWRPRVLKGAVNGQ